MYYQGYRPPPEPAPQPHGGKRRPRRGAKMLLAVVMVLLAAIAALVISILGSFFGARMVAMVLSDALLIWAFFRMLSKDRYRRAHENEVYLSKTEGVRRGVTEWLNRVKNGKKYRYFTCPKCKQRLRVPRGVGNVTITCKSCGTKFDKKA